MANGTELYHRAPSVVSAVLPAQLVEELEQLRNEGYAADAVESEGWAVILFHGYPLPGGFNSTVTDLLLKVPMSYPHGRPDMFWTDESLVLRDGRIPKNADSVEPALGRNWRRFSWHPTAWNPATDNLRTYLEFVNRRLNTPE